MSERYKLNWADWKKIIKGAGIAGVGAVLIYLVDLIPNIDFGVWIPAFVALGGVITNIVRKYFTKN